MERKYSRKTECGETINSAHLTRDGQEMLIKKNMHLGWHFYDFVQPSYVALIEQHEIKSGSLKVSVRELVLLA